MTNVVIQPENWAPAKGYANGVLTPDGTLYVGGQIGWGEDQIFRTHDFIGQMEQALLNIKAVVETAGGTVQDIVRLTWYVTDKKEYLARQREVGEAYRRIFGRNFPAMTMVVVSGLIEDQALVEIEATAVLARDKIA
jgi:enamine deaminase RidA (YjgF/YER057c/UK114 family)